MGERRLRATTSCPEAIERSELAMICVGTPGRPNGQLNVEAVARIGEEIGQAFKSRTALSSRDTLHDSLHVARQGPQICPKAPRSRSERSRGTPESRA